MYVSARGHLGQFSGNGGVDILLTLSAMKGRGCRLSQWQLVKSLDRELGRTAVAPTDGDPFINRRDPHIGRLTQGAPDHGRHRRRIAGAHSLDAQERPKSLSGLALEVLQARRPLPGIAEVEKAMLRAEIHTHVIKTAIVTAIRPLRDQAQGLPAADAVQRHGRLSWPRR